MQNNIQDKLTLAFENIIENLRKQDIELCASEVPCIVILKDNKTGKKEEFPITILFE